MTHPLFQRLAFIGLIGCAPLSAVEPGSGNDLGIDQVPAPVKATIVREAGDQPIRWVQRGELDGAVVYTVRIRETGLDRRIIVDANGALLDRPDWGGSSSGAEPLANDQGGATAKAEDRDIERDITIDQAPVAAQNAIRGAAGSEPIRWVQRDSDHGQLVYRARIRQEGIDKRVTVAPDGTVLEITQFDAINHAWAATKSATAAAIEKTKDATATAVEKTKEGVAKAWDATKEGATKAIEATKDATRVAGHQDSLTLADLPAAARATIEREAAGREIVGLARDTGTDGVTTYRADIRASAGTDLVLNVAADGTVIAKP